MRNVRNCLAAGCLFLFAGVTAAQKIGDVGAILFHLDQSDIENGRVRFDELVDHGALLFTAVFNKFDGQGRPGSTGAGAVRIPGSAPAMIRTSAPDASSCAGCHNQPRAGGAGDSDVQDATFLQ